MELSNYWAADFETTPYSQYLIDEKNQSVIILCWKLIINGK